MARKNRWPTPAASDGRGRGRGDLVQVVRGNWNPHISKRMLPTPTVNENYNRKGASPSSGDGLATVAGGPLNPTWVEWLMGFPLGWTDLGVSETP
jgi:hypothetical protein